MTLWTIPSRSSFNVSLSTLVVAVGLCTGLVACGSGGGNNAGTVGSQPSPAGPQYAYVASAVDNKIYMYSVNPSTGQLKENGTVPTKDYPVQIAFDPDHKFAYVANNVSHDVSMYILDKATGKLAPNGVPNTIFTQGLNPVSVTVDPTGSFVYVANVATANVSAFSIMPDGTLKFITLVPTPHEPYSVTVDPKGNFVYVAAGQHPPQPQTVPPTPTDNKVYSFKINPDGSLNLNGSLPAPEVAIHVLVHPFFPSIPAVYAISGVSTMITAYQVNTSTGALTTILPPGSQRTGDIGIADAARAVAVDHTGKFAYVANIGTNNVSTFSIHPTTGALTRIGSPTPLPMPAAGTKVGNEGARWVTTHPSGDFLYVTYLTEPPPQAPSHVLPHIAVFHINTANGELTHIADTPIGDGVTPGNTGAGSVSISIITP